MGELVLRSAYYMATAQICEDNIDSHFYRQIRIMFTDFYHNILALARVMKRIEKKIADEVYRVEIEHDKFREILRQTKNDKLENTDEDAEYLRYLASQRLNSFLLKYEDLELETHIANKGLVISSYSLFEDTLLKFTKVFRHYIKCEENIEVVCKRDRGIFKYIKYLEKACGVDLANVKNGIYYNKICSWNKIRNHLVHVGDVVPDENNFLTNELNKLNISLSKNKIFLRFDNTENLLNTIDKLLSEIVESCWKFLGLEIFEIDFSF
ncbi:hypothetical protein CI793_14440 [Anoxybacillus ayderensis]|uniref:hypothetical protein n=1 Tax=Anoxybacillus sp. ST70 TaxID=2864180 RepID=UPI0002E1E6DC|nr:hypothetical protein [Anoxybacillus sp. ST70]AXM88192.1 hypothetical protein B379_02760 [Anoxybacillus ayderensis G10]MBW9217350.1 hypothetical protein [Anoxybacillus sp. ST70]THD14702.1 hypothetical protein CI793_14440 [Anoxybacillus ayderensis]